MISLLHKTNPIMNSWTVSTEDFITIVATKVHFLTLHAGF